MSVYTISPSNDGARLYTMTDVYHLLIVHLHFNRTIDSQIKCLIQTWIVRKHQFICFTINKQAFFPIEYRIMRHFLCLIKKSPNSFSKFSNSKQRSWLRIYRGGKNTTTTTKCGNNNNSHNNIISIKQELIFMSKQVKCCKQTSALERGHTVGMCRTLTALGVLYHNYRIINTPPPSQEGLYRMHDAGCRVRWGEGKVAGTAERTHWQWWGGN